MKPFDIALHLIGEQNIPNYIAIRHLDAKQHLLLATEKTAAIAKRLRYSLTEYDIKTQLIGDAFQMKSLIEVFSALRKNYEGKRIALNVTGGTKLMAIALLHVFTNMPNRESFYIEAHERKELVHITKNKVEPLKPCFETVRAFITLQSDDHLSRSKDIFPSETECSLAKAFRKYPHKEVQHIVADFGALLQDKKKRTVIPEQKRIECEVKAFKLLDNSTEKTELQKLKDRLTQEDFWRFLAGKWFEIYTYSCLQNASCLREKIRNLRLNVPLFFGETEDEKQEFDLLYTDGFHLYILECKCKWLIKQEDIQKLENLTQRYGGVFGRGVLISAVEQTDQNIRERISSSRNIILVDGARVERLATALQQWRPGCFME